MKIDWTEIKKEIIAETSAGVSLNRNIKLDAVLSLFIEVLLFPVEEKNLIGLQTRLPSALKKLFSDPISRTDKNAFFGEVAVIEPFLRKVLYLTNYTLYKKIVADKKGLGAIIACLKLNPDKVDFSDPSKINKNSINFSYDLAKAYNLRNIEGHNCSEWSNSRLYDELRSALVIYIYTTFRHYKKLKIAINPFDVTPYLNSFVNRVNSLQNKFIHIRGKESIDEIPLYGREFIVDENEETTPREGTIKELRKQIKERKMVVLGDVGMGKSTTLIYLALDDAKACLNDNSKSIPVYIELKNLNEKFDLRNSLNNQIKIDNLLLDELLRMGKLNLYLDGLNEIEKNIKPKIFRQIHSLIERFPLNFFLITSRPQHYNREFDDIKSKIPVFSLQKMKEKQIEEFINKNGENVKSLILAELNQNERLKKLVQTPLILTILISVVIRDGEIPSEKGILIKSFMHSLYHREQQQIIDFDVELFHILLCYLGFQTRDLSGSNSGLDKDEYIIPLLQQRKEELGTSVNIIDFLKKAKDLNILVSDVNQISFSHELYQEYYAAEFLHQLLQR
ncbi:NACHT domain-containing protein [Flavobacteriales bacterium]|nr:NACHT domain-containing protein [Flavobacteriales bacterium]